MDDQDWLAERFEANRSHLRGVAYPDARLRDRGGRRRPGSLDPAEPHRHERCRQPAGLVDDGRRAGLPQHVALAQDAPRSVARDPPPGPDPEPGSGNGPGAGSVAGRLGRARDARGPRLPDARRAGRLRAARRVRRAVRRDRTDRRPDAGGNEAAREPRPAPRPGRARARRRPRWPMGRRRRLPCGGARR